MSRRDAKSNTVGVGSAACLCQPAADRPVEKHVWEREEIHMHDVRRSLIGPERTSLTKSSRPIPLFIPISYSLSFSRIRSS